MSEYEYFTCFLDAIKEGASQEKAWALVAYEQGLIIKEEVDAIAKYFEGKESPFPEEYQEIPTDEFEKVVFLTAWNELVQANAWKMMHNGMVFHIAEKEGDTGVPQNLIHHYPQTLDELALQKCVEALLADKKGEKRTLIVRFEIVNRRSIFAFQCLVGLSEAKIRQLIRSNERKLSLTIAHAGNGKFTKLKELLRPYGLRLAMGRL